MKTGTKKQGSQETRTKRFDKVTLDGRREAAYHEAGHVALQWMFGHISHLDFIDMDGNGMAEALVRTGGPNVPVLLEMEGVDSGQWTGKVVGGASSSRQPTVASRCDATGSRPPRKSCWEPACWAATRSSARRSTATSWRTRPTRAIPAKFYQADPCNWYARFFHEHSIDHKAYGFCYDDVSEQAAFFSGKGQRLVVTLY